MWLRDLLPQVLPSVRTMTYGYNASLRNFTANQDVRSIAAKLLAELADVRMEAKVSDVSRTTSQSVGIYTLNKLMYLKESRRPIVLVCHSLGGIVAKKVGLGSN